MWPSLPLCLKEEPSDFVPTVILKANKSIYGRMVVLDSVTEKLIVQEVEVELQ